MNPPASKNVFGFRQKGVRRAFYTRLTTPTTNLGRVAVNFIQSLSKSNRKDMIKLIANLDWLSQTSVPSDKDVEYYSSLYLRKAAIVTKDWDNLLWGIADGMALREILSGRLKHLPNDTNRIVKDSSVDWIYFLDFEEDEIEVWKKRRLIGHIKFPDLAKTDLSFWGIDVEEWVDKESRTLNLRAVQKSSLQPPTIPERLFANLSLYADPNEMKRATEAARKEAERILAKVDARFGKLRIEKVAEDQGATTETGAKSETTSRSVTGCTKPVSTQFSSENFNFCQQPLKNPFINPAAEVTILKPKNRKSGGELMSRVLGDIGLARPSRTIPADFAFGFLQPRGVRNPFESGRVLSDSKPSLEEVSKGCDFGKLFARVDLADHAQESNEKVDGIADTKSMCEDAALEDGKSDSNSKDLVDNMRNMSEQIKSQLKPTVDSKSMEEEGEQVDERKIYSDEIEEVSKI